MSFYSQRLSDVCRDTSINYAGLHGHVGVGTDWRQWLLSLMQLACDVRASSSGEVSLVLRVLSGFNYSVLEISAHGPVTSWVCASSVFFDAASILNAFVFSKPSALRVDQFA